MRYRFRIHDSRTGTTLAVQEHELADDAAAVEEANDLFKALGIMVDEVRGPADTPAETRWRTDERLREVTTL